MLMHYQYNRPPGVRDLATYPRGLCSVGAVLLEEPVDLGRVNEVQLRVWASQARGRGDLHTLELMDAELSGRAAQCRR